MTISASTVRLFLADFTANELPTKKWMGLISPKIRLRIRAQDRGDFVSATVRAGDRTSIRWPWARGDERFPRPFFADDDIFEVEIERRFLFRYKCIRRTKPVSIDQVRIGDHCALSLYDGQLPVEMLEDRIEIGEITFTLQSDVGCEDVSYESTVNSSTYSHEIFGPRKEQGQRRRGTLLPA